MFDDSAQTVVLARDEPGHVLADLWARGIRSVLLEGGPTVAGAFLAAGVVDVVEAYLAPKLLGAGPALLGPAGVATIAEAIELDVEAVDLMGPDIHVTARLRSAGMPPRDRLLATQ